jgi:hypothetical protein
MKAQHRTLQVEDVYQANLRQLCCPAPAKRITVSVVLADYGHYQGDDPFGGFALLTGLSTTSGRRMELAHLRTRGDTTC